MKSRKLKTFENCAIFSNLYFSFAQGYKVTMSGAVKHLNSMSGSFAIMTFFLKWIADVGYLIFNSLKTINSI